MRIKWHRSDCIQSTNSYLAGLQGGDPDYDYEVAVSAFQTAGRGQRGNSWESQPGKNLLFSILAHPADIGASEQFFISQAISLAVSESVARFLGPESGAHVRVKWPNDIYWKDSKMAGILIEHSILGRSIANTIVGVGLDVNQTVFESDAPNPISMAMVAGHGFDMEPILQDIILRFAGLMDQCSPEEKEAVNRMYHERMYRNSGFHRFADSAGEFKARIIRVEPNGCLVLETDAGGLRTYEFKQVRFLLSSSVD